MAQYKQWDIKLVDSRTKKAISVAATAVVMQTGLSDLVTLLADQQGTSLSQPVAVAANDTLTFYTAKSVSTVDISILTATGEAIYAVGLTSSQHRLDINPDVRHQMLVFPMIFNAGGTVTDTGFDLPANILVKDCSIRVLTVDATETVDVGILASEAGGDEDGFLLVMDVASLGFVNAYGVVTGGTNIDYVVHTSGYGAFLKQGIAGADAVATVGGVQRRYYRTDGTAKSLTYTPTSSDTFKGLGYLEWIKLA